MTKAANMPVIDEEFLYTNREFFENNPDADPEDTSFLTEDAYLSDVDDNEYEEQVDINCSSIYTRAN